MDVQNKDTATNMHHLNPNRLKPGFDGMFFSCGKNNIWKCAYVGLCSNDMVKAHMVSELSVICLVMFAKF